MYPSNLLILCNLFTCSSLVHFQLCQFRQWHSRLVWSQMHIICFLEHISFVFNLKYFPQSCDFMLLLQATRHARRVYVGGLPPTANEQVYLLYRSFLFSSPSPLFFCWYMCTPDILNIYLFLKSVATFFSQVMAAIGGNTAGPGMSVFSYRIDNSIACMHFLLLLMLVMFVFSRGCCC